MSQLIRLDTFTKIANRDVQKVFCLEPAANSDQQKCNAVIYLVDVSEVPDFSTMYELYDPCTVMFFFRNKVSSCCAGHRSLSPSGDFTSFCITVHA